MIELVQYVNPDGSLTGETEEKLAAHNAHTRKHLAFSSYVFNHRGQFLVTQRAKVKKVWPTVWTNTCCGHPFPGESLEHAIRRRNAYELGITQLSDLTLIAPVYSYETPPFKGITENEFCPIYAARLIGDLQPNPAEVDDCRWLGWDEYKKWQNREPDAFSYWCKDQLALIDRPMQDYIKSLAAA